VPNNDRKLTWFGKRKKFSRFSGGAALTTINITSIIERTQNSFIIQFETLVARQINLY